MRLAVQIIAWTFVGLSLFRAVIAPYRLNKPMKFEPYDVAIAITAAIAYGLVAYEVTT